MCICAESSKKKCKLLNKRGVLLITLILFIIFVVCDYNYYKTYVHIYICLLVT